MIIKNISRNIDRSPQSIMLQLGSRRCYLLKENGELMTFDSCLCHNSSEIYSVSNRGFSENTEKVIWPIKEYGLTDLEGVKVLIQGMISMSLKSRGILSLPGLLKFVSCYCVLYLTSLIVRY